MNNEINDKKSQIPTFTVILAAVLSAVAALLARGVYGGWLWLAVSAGFGAVAAFASGRHIFALAPLFGSAAAAVLYAPLVPAWSAAAALLAYFICLSAEGKMTKNTSLVASAAALLLLALLQFASDTYITGGELSPAAIWATVKAPFSEIKSSMLGLVDSMEGSDMPMYGMTSAELGSYLDSMKTVMLRSLPSIAIVSALVVSWLAHAVFGGCVRFLAPPQVDKRGGVTMSLAAAIIFTAAFLISFLLSSSAPDSVATVSAENLTAVLTPGFLAVGLRTVLTGAKQRTGGGAIYIMTAVICLAALISSAGIAAMLFVLVGLIHTFREEIRARRRED